MLGNEGREQILGPNLFLKLISLGTSEFWELWGMIDKGTFFPTWLPEPISYWLEHGGNILQH